MLVYLLAATSLLLHPSLPSSDPWTLKPNLSSTSKLVWNINLTADAGGQNHEATFDFVESGRDGDKAKGQPVRFEMANVVADGSGHEGGLTDAVVDSQNASISSSDGDWQKCLAPLTFIYPTAPISPGDTWKQTSAASSGPKFTYTFKAKQIEKVDNVDTMMITSTFSQEEPKETTAEGSWWVDSTGKVIKFTLNLKQWFVPMIHMSIDATMTGKQKG